MNSNAKHMPPLDLVIGDGSPEALDTQLAGLVKEMHIYFRCIAMQVSVREHLKECLEQVQGLAYQLGYTKSMLDHVPN